jgi:hypothetical protein
MRYHKVNAYEFKKQNGYHTKKIKQDSRNRYSNNVPIFFDPVFRWMF